MRPLTLEKPKPLLEVGGQTILERIINALPQEISELIVVVGYLKDKIQDFLGRKFRGLKIHYVFQPEKTGTGHALQLCRPILLAGEKFLVLTADDLRDKRDLENLCAQTYALGVQEVLNPECFGVVIMDNKNRVMGFEEKPAHPRSNLVSTGAIVLDSRVFNYEPARHPNGEYYLVSMVEQMLKDHAIYGVKELGWIPIGYPEDLLKAEKILQHAQR